jgi:uncharacterized protein YqiB (DUF1249 family)
MELVSDHLCRISWRCPPRSFVSLMTLYESNYIRLGWLIPHLDTLEGHLVSEVDGDPALHLEVIERTPYTLLFNLSYRLADRQVPDMQVRVYRDARVAEAHSCAGAPAGGAELQKRWARNMMLNKWLEYCAGRGHRFRR